MHEMIKVYCFYKVYKLDMNVTRILSDGHQLIIFIVIKFN